MTTCCPLFDALLPGTERVLLKMLNDRYLPLEVNLELLERDCHGAIGHQHSVRC